MFKSDTKQPGLLKWILETRKFTSVLLTGDLDECRKAHSVAYEKHVRDSPSIIIITITITILCSIVYAVGFQFSMITTTTSA